MRLIQPGHIYGLMTKEGGEQILTFFKDLPHDAKDNHDGVLCQEVIRALIDRVVQLNNQKPCHESTEIIILLRKVLMLFELRAFKGTLEKSFAKCGLEIEHIPTKENGHIFDLTSESFTALDE